MAEPARDVYIVDAVRTRTGRYGGALAGVRPDDLAALTITTVVERSGLDPAQLDDVYFGNANGAGEENRNVARLAALLAGLPVETPGATVNRLCASGLEAFNQAARSGPRTTSTTRSARTARSSTPTRIACGARTTSATAARRSRCAGARRAAAGCCPARRAAGG